MYAMMVEKANKVPHFCAPTVQFSIKKNLPAIGGTMSIVMLLWITIGTIFKTFIRKTFD